MPVPSSTYRLQLTAGFTLSDAARLTSYLAELGVGAVYLSPLLRATAGSTHGYDVVEHSALDPDRGGPAGLKALVAACAEHDLQLVVDIVPNHMGVASPVENRAWWDVLKYGRASSYADWFDIDWAYFDGRIVIPVLADEVDLDSELTLTETELRYHEHRYPLAPGSRTDGDGPSAVHDRQHYVLVNFRKADIEQNYRRFFAVTELAGLRVEDPAVFDATHREILRWVTEYGVAGIRVDHPDGLLDPAGYLDRLSSSAPDAWITVEKITDAGERLPESWPVAGTTGYDALAEVNNVLVDPDAEGRFDQLYRDLTGDQRDWSEHAAGGKRLVATTILQAEINRLARLVPDVTHAVAALTELAVAFPVYRSYLPIAAGYLELAVERVRTLRPDLSETVAQLMPRLTDPADELCVRFQQVTGAIMAKGVEDTAYYRYNRFIALNEVGGSPGRFGLTIGEFHDAQQRRQAIAPNGMTTLSTHDTKRGEDVRARLAVLAELPDEWENAAVQLLDAAPVPNRAFGYLLWQTFAATGLIERERMHAYAQKAMREAAAGTGWIDPDVAFEDAVHTTVDAAYDNPAVARLISRLHDRIEPYGRINSLSQKLIQLTMPGVPDVYQGTELWEDSLVDPDNRRAVDFATRRQRLGSLAGLDQGPAVDDSGRAKLWLIRQTLRARAERPKLFARYTPLRAQGSAHDHLVAFDRGGAITLATRLPVGLESAGGWNDTVVTLPEGEYRDALTGTACHRDLPVSDALGRYPVALLLREQARDG
jgi:(1->4)-alpha-D-glucan 1-alpha-D-glucosylmutase